jgi:hypothetical protein
LYYRPAYNEVKWDYTTAQKSLSSNEFYYRPAYNEVKRDYTTTQKSLSSDDLYYRPAYNAVKGTALQDRRVAAVMTHTTGLRTTKLSGTAL